MKALLLLVKVINLTFVPSPDRQRYRRDCTSWNINNHRAIVFFNVVLVM